MLVVNDNEDSADTMAALLEIKGNEVMTAYGGELPLALAETFRPTVVLLERESPSTRPS